MVVEYDEVSQKCQFFLAHILVHLLNPKDQAVVNYDLLPSGGFSKFSLF